MKSVQTFPFFVALPGDVKWSPWKLNGKQIDSYEDLPQTLRSSDKLVFSMSVKLGDEFESRIKMQDHSFYNLVIEVRCTATRYLANSQSPTLEKSSKRLEATLEIDDPKRLAGEVKLSATIVGPGYVTESEDVPAIPKARLASTVMMLDVHGDPRIIPTREVEGLGIPWKIKTNFDEPADNFQSNLYPVLNADNKKMLQAFKSGDKVLKWALASDVMRASIQSAAIFEMELGEVDELVEEYPESLIAAVDQYAKRINPDWTAWDLLQAYRDKRKTLEIENLIKQTANDYV